MKIAVVGSGYVGLVTAACFADLGNRVICVDKDPEKIRCLKRGRTHFFEPGLQEIVEKNWKAGRLRFTRSIAPAVRESQIIFIAVGTPSRDNGEADLRQVETVARSVARSLDRYKLIVEKSTVPVQTGERIKATISRMVKKKAKFDVASNPEFLREGSAVDDFLRPDRIVIGTESARARRLLKELYKEIGRPIIFTDMNSAELIKHASNSFLAMKISFINAMARICEKTGADVEEVADGMGRDPRIGRNFLHAGLGFGGSCFPKDLSAFIRISDKLGYDFKLLKAVQEINEDQVRNFLRKTETVLGKVSGKTLGVWGLAFKPNTDDLRGALSLTVIRTLKEKGALIRAYDPRAMEKAKKEIPFVHFSKDAYDACKGCEALLILTEWNDFKGVDLVRVKKFLKRPVIIDGRNLFEVPRMRRLGFRYISIGRRSV